jgi:hypothetical protein
VSFHFVKEALIASGVTKEEQIHACSHQLDELLTEFGRDVTRRADPVLVAQDLFGWLWRKKPNRYKPGGSFRLHEVIGAQMNESKERVGNCLGLTLLYNSLLRRKRIEASATYLHNAFGIGPHVLTALTTEKGVIDVENIFPHGFDYKGHLKDPTRRSLGGRELVAEIYNSAGNECFENKQLDSALRNYELAVGMDPKHERAPLNILVIGDRMAMERDLESK